MLLNWASVKAKTKSLVASVIGATGVFQIPEVKNVVVGAVLHHPRISSVVVACFTVAALLHQPNVMEALGIKREVKVVESTTEVVAATGSSGKADNGA